MRPRPPHDWQPLIDPQAERRRRKGVLIGLGVLGLVGGGITVVAGFLIAGALLFAATPDGYSADDVCWANDGNEDAEGEPLAEVWCSEEHDYVSGPNVPTDEECPKDTERFLDEPDGTVTCLEPPRNGDSSSSGGIGG